jgi:hypothetical protein
MVAGLKGNWRDWSFFIEPTKPGCGPVWLPRWYNLFMRYIVLVVLTCASLSFAQETENFSGQMLNGRGWQVLPELGKSVYVTAVHDVIVSAIVQSGEVPSAENVKWAVGFNVGDYVNELNNLYKERENIRIPLPMALDYCTQKLKGHSTKQDLEARLILLRQLIATLQ